MSLIDSLKKDIHYIESLNSCMNCGVCTAICPSAEFYNYDPRIIADTVQRQDEESIEGLLKSDTIWYCGECMSCKTRCPRCNTPGGIIMALRRLSQEKGWFTESEKGRQQFALKRILGNNILNYGYCVTPDIVKPEMHPEQGPVWEWIYEHRDEVYERTHSNYKQHTFLEEPIYRISIATQNVGYNQPTQPGFYFGPDLIKMKGTFRGYQFK